METAGIFWICLAVMIVAIVIGNTVVAVARIEHGKEDQ